MLGLFESPRESHFYPDFKRFGGGGGGEYHCQAKCNVCGNGKVELKFKQVKF